MSITIPTGKFVDLLADAALFACPHEDLLDIYAVRLEWDGEMLHASSTDTLRTARVSWSPDDDEDGNDSRKSLLPYWGGGDDRWVMFIRLDEALEIVSHFKLPKKQGTTPLTLDHKGGRMVVHRAADTGHQDVKVAVVTRVIQFPDLGKVLDGLPPMERVGQLSFIRHHLGDFSEVRQSGLLNMTFNGPKGAVRITIGNRFVGTLRPDLSGQSRERTLVSVGSVDS